MLCSHGASPNAYRCPISRIELSLPASNSMWMRASWCRARPSPSSSCSVSSPGWMRAACVGSWISAPVRARSRWHVPWLFPPGEWMPLVSRRAPRILRRRNLEKRVRMLQSNHFDAVKGRRYDIIVSNPPYVGRAEMRRLPREYEHEPKIGLASGADGLDSVRAIFAGAQRHLSREGVLVVEVGNTEDTLLRTFPRLPFVWPEIAMGGGGIFLLRAGDLDAVQGELG